ncbi:Crp/Fnr family transcriptional regulator [Paenibacillus sp. J5C_2022]|uniref:Crp/Fnr family transcriptional regulator n=1 Tax=Paenibacillus sp. J5C2022 TaxID=2977129 RepID=UPI0021CE0ABD|nr:Crp/Fnr family transcriptional regulator [Paenibacillus sp. J5C2022]MCU6710849.1 Crp/Fnr family transcriptional regulator [Paenibacillus sp. J5C2022]
MRLHPKEILFRQGETGPLYRVKSGMLKIMRIHEDGTPFLVNLIAPGEIIPHHSLVTQQPYHGTAIALTTTELDVIPSEEWYAELSRDNNKCLEVAELLQSRLRTMQQRIDQLTQVAPADKLDKLRAWLNDIAGAGAGPITEILTQDEIAQFIGLRRETVNRLLRAKSKSAVQPPHEQAPERSDEH